MIDLEHVRALCAQLDGDDARRAAARCGVEGRDMQEIVGLFVGLVAHATGVSSAPVLPRVRGDEGCARCDELQRIVQDAMHARTPALRDVVIKALDALRPAAREALHRLRELEARQT